MPFSLSSLNPNWFFAIFQYHCYLDEQQRRKTSWITSQIWDFTIMSLQILYLLCSIDLCMNFRIYPCLLWAKSMWERYILVENWVSFEELPSSQVGKKVPHSSVCRTASSISTENSSAVEQGCSFCNALTFYIWHWLIYQHNVQMWRS